MGWRPCLVFSRVENWIKTYDRSGRPGKTSYRMVRKVRPGHEEILLDGTAQSLRNEETLRDNSGRPDDINSQEEARPQQFVIGNDETELELSVEARSFVNRVNDQVRKRQKRISNVTGDGEEHSMIWRIFMAVTMESAVFMGKNYQTVVIPLRIPQISHSNKCSTFLRNWCQNKMRSQVWRQLVGRIIHGNTCHYLETKESSIFNARRSTSFRILCCALGRFSKTLNRTMHGSKDQDGSNLLKATETLTESMENRRNSSGTSSQDLIRCSSATKSKIYWVDWEKHQKISQKEFYSCRCSTTFPVEQKTMKKNVWQTLDSYLYLQGNLVKDNGHSLVPGSEQKWWPRRILSPKVCH